MGTDHVAHTGVLVAGGGPAALQVLHALSSGPNRLAVTLLCPQGTAPYRPLSAYTGLVADAPPALDLMDVAGRCGGGLVLDRLASVDPRRSVARTAHGAELTYDALVVAVGAIPHPTIAGAITLGRRRDEERLRRLVGRVRAAETARIAVVVPPGASWTLPAYELALLLRHAAPHHPQIAVLTAEPAPLHALGPLASERVSALLADRDVALHTGAFPDLFDGTRLWLPWQGAVDVDAVVALPTPRGPAVPGLPHDHAGFLPVDVRGRVRDVAGVWAAGDVTDGALKHGGLAARDADVVAVDVAHELGGTAPSEGSPGSELRVVLLHGDGALCLQVERTGTCWITTHVRSEPDATAADKLDGPSGLTLTGA